MLRVTLLLGDKSRGWSSESSESSMGVSLLRRRLPREISGKSLSTVCLKPVSEAIIIVCLSLWSRVAFSCFSRGKDEERPQSTISLMMEDINYPSNQFNISWNQSIWEDANISYILSQVTGLEVCLGTNGANFSTYLFNVTRWIKIVEGHSKVSQSCIKKRKN